MLRPVAVSIGLVLAGILATTADAQVPTRASEPRLAVPRAEPVALPTQPTTAAPDTGQPVTGVTGSSLPQVSGAGSQPTSNSAEAATGALSYNMASARLTLGGMVVPTVTRVEGGTPTAAVVSEKIGPDHVIKKHVGGLKYEDISLHAGLSSKPLMDWLAASLKGMHQPKDGSIMGLDQNSNVRSVLEFFHALPTEITFPALGSTNGAYSNRDADLTVKIAPEYTRLGPGTGVKAPSPTGQWGWSASNFRFEMTGLDGSKVTRIEPFTISQKIVENPVGELRDYAREPAHLDIPNLKILIHPSGAQTWFNWQNDFLLAGNNGDDKERDGAIVFLSQQRAELGRLNLFHCGIVGLASGPQDTRDASGSKNLGWSNAPLAAELYCERMELTFPTSAK